MAYFPSTSNSTGRWSLMEIRNEIMGLNWIGSVTTIGTNAIFGYGYTGSSYLDTITRFNNTGTYVGSQENAGTARTYLAAASYGRDKAIFGFGNNGSTVNTITRFDNTGTYVGSQENAGTARFYLAAATYGGDKAIFGFGLTTVNVNTITRFDNTGTYVGSQENAGTVRRELAAASYG